MVLGFFSLSVRTVDEGKKQGKKDPSKKIAARVSFKPGTSGI